MSQPLSPAAQAVLDAVASQLEGGWISPEFIPYEARKIAAALRAAADQVAKNDPLGDTAEDVIRGAEREHMRGKFYTIAAELEANRG